MTLHGSNTRSTSPIARALADADTLVDVRSPGEFARGHIAGAVNIPLFSNGERSEIGTLYKQLGQQQAVSRGLDMVGSRLGTFVDAFSPYREGEMLIYCARGGMRSNAVVSLLCSLEFRVSRLEGGYKAFRNYALETLERLVPPHPLILHGCTGVGKTLLLRRLPNALDLEHLAQHRSSLFGAVNLTPRTQQQFEADSLAALQGLDFAAPIWIEGESRKVGNAVLPAGLRNAIQTGTAVLITATVETRVQRIIAEYSRDDPDTLDQLEAALRKLTPQLGRRGIDRMADALHAGDLESVVTTLLVEHYDPRYLHAMRGYRYALEMSSEDLDEAVTALCIFAATSAAANAAACAPAQGVSERTVEGESAPGRALGG